MTTTQKIEIPPGFHDPCNELARDFVTLMAMCRRSTYVKDLCQRRKLDGADWIHIFKYLLLETDNLHRGYLEVLEKLGERPTST